MTEVTGPGAWITINYSDANAAIDYLVRVVGFDEHVVHRSVNGAVEHAELLWPPGGGIMLGTDRGGQRWSGLAGEPGTSTAYLVTDDPDAIYDRVTAEGWMILRELHDETTYTNREFACADPEGNAWSIGTYRGAE